MGSTVSNYNIATGACNTGYAKQKNPITNQTVSCACSLSGGYFINGNSCLLCTSITASGLTVAGCQNCSQTEAYFQDGVTCIYCPGVISSTGAVTSNGCVCLASYFWNTLTGTCQCDWFNGYTLNGGSCLNCANISNTILPASTTGCSCAPGYIWNPVNLVCDCDPNGGSFFSPFDGCINCFMRGSNGKKVSNGTSCLCLAGFTWDPVQLICVCDYKQNFYQLMNGICWDCSQIANSNGLATPLGCGCANGLTWVADSCVCPSDYVNMGNTCMSCSNAVSFLSGTTLSGCNACLNSQGFFLSNGICVACSKLKQTTGAATSSGCTCKNSSLLWVSSFNGCACSFVNGGYVSNIVSGQLSCSVCTGSCNCGGSSNTIYTPTDANNGICTPCTGLPFSTGVQVSGGCQCYTGYAWS